VGTGCEAAESKSTPSCRKKRTPNLLAVDGRIVDCSVFTPLVGPQRSLIPWIMEAIFPGVKGAGRNPDHCLTSSAKVRIRGVITPLPHIPFWCTLLFPVFCQANFIAVSQTNLALHITNN
jgi:hypothetical protein